MSASNKEQTLSIALWLARLAVGLVFLFNVECALAFIIRPASYSPSFEVSGVPGDVLVRGIGILFLMWNATYPPVLVKPDRNIILFGVILAQQVIGLMGESWMWLTLPEGHSTLRATAQRFVLFDGTGLIAMGLAYWFLRRAVRQ
jgi:hypothetical protein